jgi:3-oxoacyl-[acyl-carrier-protein] synthase III
VAATARADVSLLGDPAPARTRAGAGITSVGVSLPATVVPNAPIASRLGVSDEWIERRTGIRERRMAEPEERLATHATQAAQQALDRAGVAAADVEMVIVATTTADEVLPNAAPLVAHALGASGAAAFDVGAACTGFLSALAVGSAQIEAGRARRVLVVGADFMSRITDPAFLGAAGAVEAIATVLALNDRIAPPTLGYEQQEPDAAFLARELLGCLGILVVCSIPTAPRRARGSCPSATRSGSSSR